MKTSSVLILLMMLNVSFVFSETETGTAMERKNQLIKKVENGDQKAILELGSLGDKSVVPVLRGILSRASHRNYGGEAANAQMALAKLGEKQQLKEILAEFDSDDPALQDDAIKKLTYVGGNESVRALVKLLDDKQWRKGKDGAGPKGEPPMDKVFYSPRYILAMKALAQIVPNPPVPPQSEPTEKDLPKWREWWKQNQDKYQ